MIIKDRYILHPSCKDKKQYKNTYGTWENTDLLSICASNPETAPQTEDPIYDSFASTDIVWDQLLPYLLTQWMQIFPLDFSTEKK